MFGLEPGDDPRRWTGHPDQVAGVELAELLEGDARGVRVLRLRGAEVDVDVLVDRGLDLLRARVRGVPVGWLSPAGVRHPAFAEQQGFGPLRTFGGGLLTTCGLDHVHGPRDEPDRYGHPGLAVAHHPLHGRVSALPARLLRAQGTPGPLLAVEGEVRQAAPFAEHLVLRRRIELDVAGRTLRIRDEVRNDGFTPTPLAVLYHVNVGWPVLSPSADVLADVADPRATAGDAPAQDWRRPGAPRDGATEAVWDHTPRPDAAGRGRAAVVNDDVGDGRAAGLLVSWELDGLPHLAQWTMTAAGMYVVGLEPATVGIGGVAAAEADGGLRVLAPGESARLAVDLTFLHGAADLAAARLRVHGEQR